MVKPILFSTDMTRAILKGRKTVTRRVVKPQPEPDYAKVSGMYLDSKGRRCAICYFCKGGIHAIYPPCERGDILWVRETWNCLPIPEPLRGTSKTYWYKADGTEPGDKWRPSIHMPREAVRIFLKVTNVRVERLRNITEEQAEAEGAPKAFEYDMLEDTVIVLDEDGYSYFGFQVVWNSTIKPSDLPIYGWEANPWVWVIEFERCDKPEGWPG